jgi:hypothetical protein
MDEYIRLDLEGSPDGNLGQWEVLFTPERLAEARGYALAAWAAGVTAQVTPGKSAYETPRVDPVFVNGDEATVSGCTIEHIVGTAGFGRIYESAPSATERVLYLVRSSESPTGWLVTSLKFKTVPAC